jgi:histidine ammonia-lyase
MKTVTKGAALLIDGGPVCFEDIVAVAKDGLPVAVSKSPAFLRKMAVTEKALMKSIREGIAVYGVNTGYGKSCGNRIDMKAVIKNAPTFCVSTAAAQASPSVSKRPGPQCLHASSVWRAAIPVYRSPCLTRWPIF